MEKQGKGEPNIPLHFVEQGAYHGFGDGVGLNTRDMSPKQIMTYFYEVKGMTTASYKDPLVYEAARLSGKDVKQVVNFIGNYRQSLKQTADRSSTKRSSLPENTLGLVPVQSPIQQSPQQRSAHMISPTSTMPASQTVNVKGYQGTPRRKLGYNTEPTQSLEQRSVEVPFAQEATRQTGDTFVPIVHDPHQRSAHQIEFRSTIPTLQTAVASKRPPQQISAHRSSPVDTIPFVQTASTVLCVQGSQQGTPPKRSVHMRSPTGITQAEQTAAAGMKVQGNQQNTYPQRSAHVYMSSPTGTMPVSQTAVIDMTTQRNPQSSSPQKLVHMRSPTGTSQAEQTAAAGVNVQGNQQGTPPKRSVHMRSPTGITQAAQTAAAGLKVQGNQQNTYPQRSAHVYMSSPTGTMPVSQTAVIDMTTQRNPQSSSPQKVVHMRSPTGTSQAEKTAAAGVNVQGNQQSTPSQRSVSMRSPTGTSQAVQTAAAGVKVQGNQGTPRRKRRSDSTLVEYYEKRGMTTGSVKDPLVQEAAKQTGKSPGQVVAFTKYRIKKKREQISSEGGSANEVSNASSSVAVETTTADSSGQDAASATGQMPTARSAMDDQEGKRKEKTQTVKRPADTSGRPQDKRPAGEGSSLDGHPKDELAQLREENKTLKALVQKRQGSEKANRQDGPEEEVISVLLVNGEYGTSHGGNSTTNRQVALYLKESGATVHATALQASEEDKQCAKDDKVILHLPVKKNRDKRTPSLEWLTFDHKSRYPDIPKNLKCIVGHSDVTSGAARSIQEDRCKLAKVVLFNHDIPEDTKAMEARKKMEDILEDAKNADAVFSLGKRIFHHFQTKYKSLGKSKPREHVLFRPKPSRVFEDISVGPGGGEKVVLFVGRVTKEEKPRRVMTW
ncbi:uncharacterized protein LOC144904081 [Branchiostoma floridae x Branchiostoma belcheri]